jgi:hypothetical protein
MVEEAENFREPKKCGIKPGTKPVPLAWRPQVVKLASTVIEIINCELTGCNVQVCAMCLSNFKKLWQQKLDFGGA